ncbi:MAG TPA: right-handed parallel beta-helix repeat-containing protein [Thermomicrobiales bacterium]
MTNDRQRRLSRRSLVQGAAVTLLSLITAACGANSTPTKTPTVVRQPTGTPRFPSPPPVPVPTATPSVGVVERVIYVDTQSAQADDANPGTADRPLKTVGKAATIAADKSLGSMNVRVIINPGVYRESVSLKIAGVRANAAIHFQAKENGAATIAGSDVWTGWQKQGAANIYTHPWPYTWGLAPYPAGWQGNVNLMPIVRRREMIFINGDPLRQVVSNGELKPGTFYVAEQSSTVTIVPTAGVQIEGAMIEVATRTGIFAVDGARNLTVTGLVFMHDNTAVGGTAVSFTNCTDSVVEDCQFLWNNWAGMTFESTAPQISQTMTARRNIANNNGGIGLAASRVKDVLYEDNNTSYNNWRGAQGDFRLWSNAGMKHLFIHGGVYRRHRAVGNQAPGCWFDTDCADIQIEQAFVCQNDGPGVFIEASQGPTSVTDSTICENQKEAGVYSQGGTNVTLEGNILYGNADAQIQAVQGVRPIKNWETNAASSLIAEKWTLRQNTIVGTDAAPSLADIANSAGFFKTFVAGGNVWFSPKKSGTFIVDGKGTDLKGWQSASHQDADAQFVDPRYVDPENGDFHLRDDSPVRTPRPNGP